MEEQDYLEAFGFSPSVEDDTDGEMSKNTEENTENVHETETPDDAEPEIADPAAGDEGATGKSKQSRRTNAKFAAARREAEAERDAAMEDIDARIQQARREAKEELLKEQGIENPYTQKPITNLDEYEQYKSMHREQEQQQRLRDMDMTQEQYDEYVGSLPEVQAARQQAEETRKAEFQRRLNAEIEAIGRLNPAIKSVEDLVQSDGYEEVYKRISTTGMSLEDAYKLVHYDDLATKKGRQQAINRAGKAHMSATQARGGGSVSVPSDELAMFKLLNPRATEDQIARYYNRYKQSE